MAPSECPSCHGSDFYTTRIRSEGPLLIHLGFLNAVAVDSSVCLSCGVVTSHVDGASLEILRARRAKEAGA